MLTISIQRVWAMPNKNTFDIKPINNLIKEELTEGYGLTHLQIKTNLQPLQMTLV